MEAGPRRAGTSATLPCVIFVNVLVPSLFIGLWLGSIVYWIVALVQVCRIPDYQYRVAGTEKTTWILVVALAQIIGALIWLFAKRKAVLAAAGRSLPTPPGWYIDPMTGAVRWWDGLGWTAHFGQQPTPLS
jgi:hypothetical protein